MQLCVDTSEIALCVCVLSFGGSRLGPRLPPPLQGLANGCTECAGSDSWWACTLVALAVWVPPHSLHKGAELRPLQGLSVGDLPKSLIDAERAMLETSWHMV